MSDNVVSLAGTRRRERTRERLLDAATAVFAEIGVAGASVEAVCERAGFTRGAFYSNFASKEELMLAVDSRLAEAKIAGIRSQLAELVAAGAFDGEIDITGVVRELMCVEAGDRQSMALLSEVRLNALRNPEFGQHYQRREDAFLAEVALIIDELIDGSNIRLRVDSRTAARMLAAAWENAAVRSILASDSDAELQEQGSRAITEVVSLLLV